MSGTTWDCHDPVQLGKIRSGWFALYGISIDRSNFPDHLYTVATHHLKLDSQNSPLQPYGLVRASIHKFTCCKPWPSVVKEGHSLA